MQASAGVAGGGGAREGPSPGSGAWAERTLAVLLGAGFVLAFVLSALSLFEITLSADEAWLFSAVRSLAERGEYVTGWGPGPSTTGGPYLLVQTLVYLVAGASKPALRLLPFFSLVLLVWTFVRWSRAGSIASRLLGASMLIAMPGTLTLAGSGFAAVPAALLGVWGAWLWDSERGTSRGRAAAAGALFGLAAATRINCAVVFPALLLAFLVLERERSRLPDLVLALAVGGAVTLAGFGLLDRITPSDALDFAATSAGFWAGDGARGPQGESWLVLQKWGIAEGFLPLPLLVASSLVLAFLAGRSGSKRAGLGVVVASAWMLWGAWIGIAPRPHLRYLWPALAWFALPLGVGLARIHELGRERALPWLRIGALLVGLGGVAAGCVGATRNLFVGNLNFLEAIWSETLPSVVPTDPRALKGQSEMAGYLRGLPAQEPIGVIGIWWELEFLVGRPLSPLWRYHASWTQEALPKLIVVTDHLRSQLSLPRGGTEWLQKQCQVQARFGAFTLYRVVGPYPEPKLLMLRPALGLGGR